MPLHPALRLPWGVGPAFVLDQTFRQRHPEPTVQWSACFPTACGDCDPMPTDLPDYYETLQVSNRAHPMMITRAFRLLVAFYHPDNKDTGNQEIFREVLQAYRVLSDPVRRAAYDREKFAMRDSAAGDPPTAGGLDYQPADERELRRLILEALYHVRRTQPYKPMLPIVAVAELFGRSMEEMQFSLWYLRGKKWVEMPDGSEIAITIAGVDEVEAAGIEPHLASQADQWKIMSLPESGRTSEAHPASNGGVHATPAPERLDPENPREPGLNAMLSAKTPEGET